MLKAIQNSKLKLIQGNEIKSIPNENKGKEDSLTAVVFQLLSYLPIEKSYAILSNATGATCGESLPEDIGHWMDCQFWPKWSGKGIYKDGKERKFVEPDIHLSYENLDIIIEAKRKDEDQQYRKQWTNEIQAYFNEVNIKEEESGEEDKRKKVIILALGGLRSKVTSSIFHNNITFKVYKCQWFQIVEQIKKEKENLEDSQENIPYSNIYSDLIYAFELHGFHTGKWLGDLSSYQLGIDSNSIDYLLTNKFK